MARKVKTSSNPKLATTHNKGDKVSASEALVHKSYGAISYEHPCFWYYNFMSSYIGYLTIKELHKEVLEIEPDKSNCRSLQNDSELLFKISDAGIILITNIVLAFENLCLSIEDAFNDIPKKVKEGKNIELNARLLHNLKRIKFRNIGRDNGYNRFNEILNLRHKIMHPLPEYQQSQSRSDWDKIPLSWMLSEKPLEAFEATKSLFNEIVDYWIKVAPKYQITLKVQRGIQFDHQPKKVPKNNKPNTCE